MRRFLITAAAVPALTAAIGYQQYNRLARLYPTLPVPDYLLISERTDTPVTTAAWAQCHVGDAYVATVPRRWVYPSSSASASTSRGGAADSTLGVTTGLERYFNAFWKSLPLRVEGKMIQAAHRLGWIKSYTTLEVFTPSGAPGANEQRTWQGDKMEQGDILVGGGFIIESTEPCTKASIEAGPVVLRWGTVEPAAGDGEESRANGIQGGYHSLALRTSTSTSEHDNDKDNESIDLIFACQLVLRRPLDPVDSFNIPHGPGIRPAANAPGVSPMTRILSHFHILYSRILLDLAVRRLGAAETGDSWSSSWL